MSEKYKGFKKLNVRIFIVFFSCFSAANAHNENKLFFTAKDGPVDVLEWQLAASGYGQSSLSVRIRAEPAGIKKQDRQKLPFTGSARVFGQTGQSFLVCAQSLDAEGFFQEAVAAVTPVGNAYLLRLAGTVGELTIDQGQPCPEYFGHQYPFVSALPIRSENAFSVVAKRADSSNHKAQDNNDKLIPPLNLPAKLSSRLSIAGDSQGTDDHNDFKRPPFMPVPDKMMAQLLLLPALNLSANWRDYLPFASLYHWFAGTGNQGVTLLIRFNNEPALRLDISQAEFRELIPMLPDVPQLLHWLAPKLNGREHLVQQLAGLLTQENEAVLPESAREAIERQLAIILEQPDIRFSLEFEYSQLQSALRAQKQPPGVVELGGGTDKAPPPSINQATNQPDNSKNPAKSQNNQHSQRQASQPPSAPGNDMIMPDLVIDLIPEENYILVARQTRYHINSQKVLLHLLDRISEVPLQPECQDCRQQVPLQEIVNHAQSHQLTCTECWKFHPEAVPLAVRQGQFECHTRSHCRDFRVPVLPPMPAADASLTILRLMLRFGTEETLLKLLPLITQQSMVAALGQADQEGGTFVHDLARYSPDSVTLAMVGTINGLGKAEHLEARDIHGDTPLNHLLLVRSEEFAMELRAYLDQQITRDDKTPIDVPSESGETDLIDILIGDRRLLVTVPSESYSGPDWFVLPTEILISIFRLLPPDDLNSCRVVNRRTYHFIQDHHLLCDALWQQCPPSPADLFSREAWENSISHSLRIKQNDGSERNEKNKKTVAHLEVCKDHYNFHKILFHTLTIIKPRAFWSFQLSGQMQGDNDLSHFAFSPNGRLLVTCWRYSAVCINVWQGNSPGREVFRKELDSRNTLSSYESSTWTASFSPDSRTLAAWSHQESAFFLAAVENDKWQEILQRRRSLFLSAVFSPNSKTLLICARDDTSCILTCQENNSWVELKPTPLIPRKGIISAAFTSDNQSLTVVMDSWIYHIPLSGNSERIVKFLSCGGWGTGASVSPDGLAGAIAINNQKNGHFQVRIFTCHEADIKVCCVKGDNFLDFSFSPDSQYLMLKSVDTAYIYTHRGKGIWEEIYKINLVDNLYRTSVIFGPDNRSLITISNSFFHSPCSVDTHICNSSGIWKKTCMMARLPDNFAPDNRVRFSPDGLALVTYSEDTLMICRIMFNIRKSWGDF